MNELLNVLCINFVVMLIYFIYSYFFDKRLMCSIFNDLFIIMLLLCKVLGYIM